MKFELPFNEQIYNKQMILNFNTSWRKNLKQNKKRLIYGIPMILFGGLIIYGKNNLGFLFLAIGIHQLINYYNYYSFYKKSKTTFFKSTEVEKNRQIEANESSFLEFNDDNFIYKDYKFEAKIKWETFNSFRIIEDNLFLDLNLGNNGAYVIGKDETGTEEFLKLTELVKSKIK